MKFKNNQKSSTINSKERNRLGAVIMDVQDNLLNAIDDRIRLKESIVLGADILRVLQIPFCFTEQVPQKLGTTIAELTKDTTQVPVFEKNTFSAFGSPEFSDWVKSNKISHLLILGIETTICVYQTCVDALREGLNVTVLSDCVGARRADDAYIALNQLRSFDCCIIPLETIAYSYLNNSDHPSFKDIAKLVKERTE
jgi:isochorismate hydrolase